jgi:hypothetical protein
VPIRFAERDPRWRPPWRTSGRKSPGSRRGSRFQRGEKEVSSAVARASGLMGSLVVLRAASSAKRPLVLAERDRRSTRDPLSFSKTPSRNVPGRRRVAPRCPWRVSCSAGTSPGTGSRTASSQRAIDHSPGWPSRNETARSRRAFSTSRRAAPVAVSPAARPRYVIRPSACQQAAGYRSPASRHSGGGGSFE